MAATACPPFLTFSDLKTEHYKGPAPRASAFAGATHLSPGPRRGLPPQVSPRASGLAARTSIPGAG